MWIMLPVRGLTDEQERAAAEAIYIHWIMYGQVHLTNANGFTMLDPKGVTYTPTERDPESWKSPRKRQ